jgi:hypothetical protein
MRRKPILVEAQWFTTADLARAIERSPRGATWIADRERLTCTRTPARQRLYWKADVLRLVARRTEARLRNVRALRPRRYGVPGEPRQLSFWGPRRVEPLRVPDADFTTGLGSTSRGFVPENERIR